MKVLRKPLYWESLQAIEDLIAEDNPGAAIEMWLRIDDQVSQLADPNFPRRKGRVQGTVELVAHPNYIVVLQQSKGVVTVLNVIHVAKTYP